MAAARLLLRPRLLEGPESDRVFHEQPRLPGQHTTPRHRRHHRGHMHLHCAPVAAEVLPAIGTHYIRGGSAIRTTPVSGELQHGFGSGAAGHDSNRTGECAPDHHLSSVSVQNGSSRLLATDFHPGLRTPGHFHHYLYVLSDDKVGPEAISVSAQGE